MDEMKVNTVSSYEQIAEEYYDASLHPTCRDLGKLSSMLLNPLIGKLFPSFGEVVEIGCGKSTLAPISRVNGALTRTTLIDSSARMLAYSQEWEHLGVRLSSGLADKMGLQERCASLIVSSLGDPYNTPSFWKEAYRLLSPEGRVIFTTPSYEWSSRFRSEDSRDTADFVRRDGANLQLPSYVLEKQRQYQLIEDAGLLCESHHEIGTRVLGEEIAPKLLVIGRNLPSVTAYVAVKK